MNRSLRQAIVSLLVVATCTITAGPADAVEETLIDVQLGFLMDSIDDSGAPVTDGARARLDDLQADWAARRAELRGITEQYIEPINRWASAQRLDHVFNPLGSD